MNIDIKGPINNTNKKNDGNKNNQNNEIIIVIIMITPAPGDNQNCSKHSPIKDSNPLTRPRSSSSLPRPFPI